jgi:acetyl esterase/lipase
MLSIMMRHQRSFLKANVFLLTVMFGSCVKAAVWEPMGGPIQIPVWKGNPPDLIPSNLGENFETAKSLVAGKPWHEITGVTQPTFTVYSPKTGNTGAAIVVFPGGGYKALAIDIEGTEVCDWLTSKGITCILLKYRVPDSGCHWDDKCQCHVTPKKFTALQDAQRTISTIRYQAKKYGVKPNKIGVMGFSAGGNLAVLASTESRRRAYEPIDQIDNVSSRPDFSIPVYPGHMTMEHKNKTPREVAAKELNTDIVISQDIPPTLLIHAEDDPVDPISYSEIYERELKNAGVEVRLNRYKSGGHAFGVRKSGKDKDRWTDDAINWMKTNKIIQSL